MTPVYKFAWECMYLINPSITPSIQPSARPSCFSIGFNTYEFAQFQLSNHVIAAARRVMQSNAAQRNEKRMHFTHVCEHGRMFTRNFSPVVCDVLSVMYIDV